MPKGMSATVMSRMRSNGSILMDTQLVTSDQKDYTDGTVKAKHFVLIRDRSQGNGQACDCPWP
jgi:hypothetical protein